MVRVAVRDHDGIKAGQRMPRAAEIARINQDSGSRTLDENRRMAKMGDLHTASLEFLSPIVADEVVTPLDVLVHKSFSYRERQLQ